MKYYRLEPSVKKSVIEWHSFKRKDADGNDVSVYQIQVPGVIDGIASFEIGEDASDFVTGINALYSLIISASRAGTKITQKQINEIFGGSVDQDMG